MRGIDGVHVTGEASPEELAALIAALTASASEPGRPYERWRRGRIAALRRLPRR